MLMIVMLSQENTTCHPKFISKIYRNIDRFLKIYEYYLNVVNLL